MAVSPVILLSLVGEVAYAAVEIGVVQVRPLLVLPGLRFGARYFVDAFAVIHVAPLGSVVTLAGSAIVVWIIPVGQNVSVYDGRRVAF